MRLYHRGKNEYQCPRSSVVERFLGKEEVTSSILVVGYVFCLMGRMKE